MIPVKEFQNNCIKDDVECFPQDYLKPAMYMMDHIEGVGFKIYNIFPLIQSLIPGNVKFDTTAIVFILFENHHGNVTDYVRHGNLKNYQLDIWSMFFKTEMKCFHIGNEASFLCLCYCVFICISIRILNNNIYRSSSRRSL